MRGLEVDLAPALGVGFRGGKIFLYYVGKVRGEWEGKVWRV